MPEARSVVDVIADAVVERLQGEVARHLTPVVEIAQAAAQEQLDTFLRELPGLVTATPEAVPAKVDAKDRAKRTLVQGAVATLLSVAFVAFGQAIVADGFDFTDAGDWKLVGGTVFTAVVMAVLAYVQRIVNPPKVP